MHIRTQKQPSDTFKFEKNKKVCLNTLRQTSMLVHKITYLLSLASKIGLKRHNRRFVHTVCVSTVCAAMRDMIYAPQAHAYTTHVLSVDITL